MGQAFLDLSDHGGGGMGCQNLRKWEKNWIWLKNWSKTPKKGPEKAWFGLVWFGHDSVVTIGESWKSKPKFFDSNSLKSDFEFQLKCQNLEFFDITFLDILTIIYDLNLLGLT